METKIQNMGQHDDTMFHERGEEVVPTWGCGSSNGDVVANMGMWELIWGCGSSYEAVWIRKLKWRCGSFNGDVASHTGM